MTRRLPPLAILLGLGGLVPFAACGYRAVSAVAPAAAAGAVASPDHALFALVSYGAVILSFLGAVHWGFAMSGGEAFAAGGGRASAARLAGGVMPSLAAWVALLLDAVADRPVAALALLSLGFVVVLGTERRGAELGLVPRSYLVLRVVLTSVVVVVLLGVLVMRAASLRFGG